MRELKRKIQDEISECEDAIDVSKDKIADLDKDANNLKKEFEAEIAEKRKEFDSAIIELVKERQEQSRDMAENEAQIRRLEASLKALSGRQQVSEVINKKRARRR